MNCIFRRGSKRVALYHLLWGIFGVGLLVPVSFMFGVYRSGNEINTDLYGEIFSQSAVIRAGEIDPPHRIDRLLSSMGRSEIESAEINGLSVWYTRVPVHDPRNWQRDMLASWRDEGIHGVEGRGMLKGSWVDVDGEGLIIARVSEQTGHIDIFCYVPQNSHLDIYHDPFAELGLPSPPRDAEILDYGGTTHGRSVAFVIPHSPDFIEYYLEQIIAHGWSPRSRHLGEVEFAQSHLLQRETRTISVSEDSSGRYTMITVVMF